MPLVRGSSVGVCIAQCTSQECCLIIIILQTYEMQNANIGRDFGVLVIMAFGYRVMYYLVMQYLRSGKR